MPGDPNDERKFFLRSPRRRGGDESSYRRRPVPGRYTSIRRAAGWQEEIIRRGASPSGRLQGSDREDSAARAHSQALKFEFRRASRCRAFRKPKPGGPASHLGRTVGGTCREADLRSTTSAVIPPEMSIDTPRLGAAASTSKRQSPRSGHPPADRIVVRAGTRDSHTKNREKGARRRCGGAIRRQSSCASSRPRMPRRASYDGSGGPDPSA